jgi:hypothetical protein
MARPFRLPVNQPDHVRVEGLSRLERHFATRFAISAAAYIARWNGGWTNAALLFERTSVRVTRPISDGAKRRIETAESPVRTSMGSGMSMTSSKKS